MADTRDREGSEEPLPGGDDPARPTLHLVTDADGEARAERPDSGDPPEVPGKRREDAVDRTERAERSERGERLDPVEEARALLAAVDPEATYRALLSLARPGHNDILQVLPYNRSLEFHDPRCVKVDPDPTSLDTVGLYARAAFPAFDDILLSAMQDPRNDHLWNHLQHLLLHERANVALVTNHGQIIDIALVTGAVIIAMCSPERTFGALGDRVELADLADRVNLLVSRMVATRQTLGLPALQVLQCGGRTFLSIPQTATRRRAKLDQDMVRANNVLTRHELDLQMSRRGQLLAMAASGSQDLSVAAGLLNKARAAWLKRRGEEPPEATPTLHLQPLYDGTITLMTSCDYVLPIAISLDPASPACVVGPLTVLRERDDCHRIMEWIAAAHEEATGIDTIYHWHEDDLLTQVRGLAETLRR
jgi:hypothetical protein